MELDESLVRLKDKLVKSLPQEGNLVMPDCGVTLHRSDSPHDMKKIMLKPTIVLVAGGKKWFNASGTQVELKRGQFLLTGMDLPGACHVSEASRENPYLSMLVALDGATLSELALETRSEWSGRNGGCKMCAGADASPEMLGAFLRLAELFEKPKPSPIIRSMIIREIHYHALMSDIGGSIRELNIIGTPNNQIAKAVEALKENFDAPMQIEELAQKVGMAQATFHRNFKKVTNVSPLQYQKQLRLHEARRLMLFENETASNAAYAVGYESPSQFSREYKRFFGESPHRDLARHAAAS